MDDLRSDLLNACFCEHDSCVHLVAANELGRLWAEVKSLQVANENLASVVDRQTDQLADAHALTDMLAEALNDVFHRKAGAAIAAYKESRRAR